MKKFASILIVLFFVHSSFAQIPFEGIIKWKMELLDKSGQPVTGAEINPVKQAELAESIKELENQLKDPETKVMLDANPEMKKMLESQLLTLKAMQGTGGDSQLMPTSYTIKMKDGNSYTSFNGGAVAMMGDMLYVKSTDKTYFINNTKKTFSILPKGTEAATKDSSIIKVTPTTVTKKIMNYTCTKYIVTITENKKNQTMTLWATKELKQYTRSSFATKTGQADKVTNAAWSKIEGIPLSIEVTEEGQTMIIEMIELKYSTLPAADFIVPTGYKSVPFGQ